MTIDILTRPASGYPMQVTDLVPLVRDLATENGGELPSRAEVMRRFKVGAPKATAALEALQAGELVTGSGPLGPGEPASTYLVTTNPAPPEPAPEAPAPAVEAPGTDPIPVARPDATPLVAVPVDPVPPIASPGPVPGSAGPVAPVPAAPVAPGGGRVVRSWPVYLIALPAFVAIWSGWVGLGELTGFGPVHPLPGIADDLSLNTAITLPIGVEVYAAYALRAWLSGDRVPRVARRFAKWSAIASLVVGSGGQVAYHLMESAGITTAPWQITTAVSCLPVIVLGMGAALAHLLHTTDNTSQPTPTSEHPTGPGHPGPAHRLKRSRFSWRAR